MNIYPTLTIDRFLNFLKEMKNYYYLKRKGKAIHFNNIVAIL